MQYSLFTHGNALRIETPENLAAFTNLAWGTQITFREPVPQDGLGDPVYDSVGPGSWFHMPLTSTLTTFGYRSPRLDSVTILFETSHCRITNVHVYDGVRIIEEFNDLGLRGSFLETRDSKDINPESPSPVAQSFPNTRQLRRPHKMFSATGVSFFACAFFEDFDKDGRAHNPHFDGPFPPAILTVSAAGGQFLVDDPLSLGTSSGVVNVNINLSRETR